MVNYKKTKIYKLVDKETGECYIGGTVEPSLARRLAKYRHVFKKFLEGNSNINFCQSFNILKNDNFEIILIKEVDCDTKDQMHSHIYQEVEKHNCINKEKIKDKEKFIKDNKHIITKWNKEYYEKNKESINKKQNEKFNCECGGKYTKRNKTTHYKSKLHNNYINNK